MTLFYHGSATYIAVEQEGGEAEHVHFEEDANVTPFSSAHLNAVLAKFTLGNLGEAHGYCGVANFSESSSKNSNTQAFQIKCHSNTRLGKPVGFW